jgi:septum formation protein
MLILASTSVYRRELLARLKIAFRCEKPEVDETPLPGEPPRSLAKRLAREKSLAVARRFPGFWVLGGDQVADHAGRVIGKPGSVASARAQLSLFSGSSVAFYSAICLSRCTLATDAATETAREAAPEIRPYLDTTSVKFRRLSAADIDAYLAAEPALDCAGSFKSEGLGITLLDRIDSIDPTALIGLPLIKLAAMLREVGLA